MPTPRSLVAIARSSEGIARKEDRGLYLCVVRSRSSGALNAFNARRRLRLAEPEGSRNRRYGGPRVPRAVPVIALLAGRGWLGSVFASTLMIHERCDVRISRAHQ